MEQSYLRMSGEEWEQVSASGIEHDKSSGAVKTGDKATDRLEEALAEGELTLEQLKQAWSK